MKNLLTLMLCLFSSFALFGQIPQAFNYQATVRNLDGEIQYEIAADFEIEILQNGNSIYSEQHLDLNTGLTGVVNFKVGDGTNPSSDFSEVDWSIGGLQIRVNLNGEEMGLADIVAVPFALYAQSSGDSHWSKTDSTLYYLDTDVGIGTASPGVKLQVLGTVRVGEPGEGNTLLSLNSERSWIFKQTGTGVSTKLELKSVGGGGNKTFIINTAGRVGIGKTDPDTKLDVFGSISAGKGSESLDGNTLLVLNSERSWIFKQTGAGAGTKLELKSVGGGGNKDFLINTDGKVGIGTVSPQEKLHIEGTTQTCVLKITGGCDIKEDLNSTEELESGDVVVIDENNPGNIRRTTEEYDRKVAGIISGANGINPGISLSQDDVLEGEYPLTMLGRVYVKVTGKVEVGDMLTTSSKAGYAMAVNNYSKAHGTVIGKAMTSQEEGEGMVLVLVNLQ